MSSRSTSTEVLLDLIHELATLFTGEDHPKIPGIDCPGCQEQGNEEGAEHGTNGQQGPERDPKQFQDQDDHRWPHIETTSAMTTMAKAIANRKTIMPVTLSAFGYPCP